MQMRKTARRVAAVGAMSMPLAFAVSGIAGAATLPAAPDLPSGADLPSAPDLTELPALPGANELPALPGANELPAAEVPTLPTGDAVDVADLVGGAFGGQAHGSFSGSHAAGSGMESNSAFAGASSFKHSHFGTELPSAPAVGDVALPEAPALPDASALPTLPDASALPSADALPSTDALPPAPAVDDLALPPAPALPGTSVLPAGLNVAGHLGELGSFTLKGSAPVQSS